VKDQLRIQVNKLYLRKQAPQRPVLKDQLQLQMQLLLTKLTIWMVKTPLRILITKRKQMTKRRQMTRKNKTKNQKKRAKIRLKVPRTQQTVMTKHPKRSKK
jgi:hypothetical protein